MLDSKTAEQAEKLKQVVNSKQHLSQAQQDGLNQEPPKKKEKNKISKINNTYQIANQTNLGRKMLNRQIELLNQKEQREKAEKLNQRMKSQNSARGESQSPARLRQVSTNQNHKRGTSYF